MFPHHPPPETEGLNRGWKWAVQTKGNGPGGIRRGTSQCNSESLGCPSKA